MVISSTVTHWTAAAESNPYDSRSDGRGKCRCLEQSKPKPHCSCVVPWQFAVRPRRSMILDPESRVLPLPQQLEVCDQTELPYLIHSPRIKKGTTWAVAWTMRKGGRRELMGWRLRRLSHLSCRLLLPPCSLLHAAGRCLPLPRRRRMGWR